MVDAVLQSLLRRDRYVVLACLLILTGLAWGYLLWLVGNMTMPSSDMTMTPAPWTVELPLAFTMWAIMMVGMMTPSVAPVILLYARMGRQAASTGTPFAATGWFAAGYFLAWISFSILAATAQI